MELRKDTEALLDQVQIYNFGIRDFCDFKALQEAGIIVVKENAKFYITTESGKRYSSIHIKDESGMFIELTYAISFEGQAGGTIIMTVPDDGYHNLNCLTPEEYRDRIAELQRYLMDRYGIIADFTYVGYRQLEINRTIVLNGMYEEYQRPLTLMTYLFPGTLRLKGEQDYSAIDQPARKAADMKRSKQTYVKSSGDGKKGLTVKIYDKSRELLEVCKISVNYNYLRFELTLRSPQKIKDCLGTNKVCELSEEDIDRYFTDFIRTNVVVPYEKQKEKRDRYLRLTVKRNYQPLSRTWVRDTLLQISNQEIENGGIPVMLDVEELIPILSDLKMTGKKARYNAKCHFREVCREKIPAYANRDDLKYEELLNKLQ